MTNLTWSSTERRLAELESQGVRLGLREVIALLEDLGNPHERVAHVLVAGTNGKGSTAAFLTAMLAAAGYRSGLYTSPHLESVRERIRVEGRAIERREFSILLDRVLELARSRQGTLPTYFEALTVAAFERFTTAVDLAVMEVGLGGRLDATNVGQPRLSIITEIGLDHTDVLGGSLAEIAREKAGVMRRGRKVLTWVSEPAAREALGRLVHRAGAEWIDVRSEVSWEVSSDSAAGNTVNLQTPVASYSLTPRIWGRHQVGNIALAIRAAEVLADNGWLGLTAGAREEGVARCRWPGRLEAVELPGGKHVLLDAAHNPQSAKALAEHLALAGEPYTLLFGCLADKDAAGSLAPLAEGARAVVLTKPPSARAAAPEELATLLAQHRPRVLEEPAQALDAALEEGDRVVVCGSIYLVGAARRRLRRRFGVPVAATDIDISGRSRA